MTDHNHVAHGDVAGCPACDKREGRPAFLERRMPDDEPRVPDLSSFPEVQHRIEGGRFVCPGDENARCHRYPDCDGEHEYWPCGCEYIGHPECWMKPWIDASGLSDSHDEGADNVDAFRDADFPDGDVEARWECEDVLWNYTDQSLRTTDPSAEHEGGEGQ